jgi:NodT family efflux transporter outer membrane factor (OMF) lipoprotein
MKIRRLLGAGVLALAGCAAGPSYRTPAPDLPDAFSAQLSAPTPQPAPRTPQVDLAAWWKALEDPELNSLIDRAVAANPDLEVALTRLQQARTYESVVVGHALPEVDASAAAGRGTGSDLTRSRAQQPLVSADNGADLKHINLIAGFDAVWELDLFGKFRREIEAAHYDTQAAAAARDGVLTSVIADVVRAYVDLRGLQIRAGILNEASKALRESLRIETIRYQRGITNELDVALATRELDTLNAEIRPVEAEVSAAKYTIAVLLGEYPEKVAEELAKPALIPSIPGPAAPGVPLDLLRRRPDVLQSERELASATAHIGVATANLFPQVALVGSIGAQGQGWGTTPAVNKHIWSFGPAAIWPLLDFGALDAQVNVTDLEAHARLVRYRSTILHAVQEVDSALDSYSADQDRMTDLGEAMLAAQRAVDLANQRYDRGLTDYLNVIDAERQFYQLQEQYAAAQVSQADDFVRLYKSLGGGWQNYQTVPDIRPPQPAVIAAFRRVLTSAGTAP